VEKRLGSTCSPVHAFTSPPAAAETLAREVDRLLLDFDADLIGPADGYALDSAVASGLLELVRSDGATCELRMTMAGRQRVAELRGETT